jgi:peptidoglycan/LPS O-acetylase OafA/YrhL
MRSDINKQQHRIEFANALRGIAALVVVFGHYVLVFNAIRGGYRSFPPLPEPPFPLAAQVFTTWPLSLLNVGPFGVAIFFLISGLVIPISVDKLGKVNEGRIAFVIGRLFRIWPTYWAGLTVSVLAIAAGAALIGVTPVFRPNSEILANASLFRDWLGHHQIDGVVWTLEIEAKFYLFILVFWVAIRDCRLLPLFIIAGAAILAAPLGVTYDMTLGAVGIPNFLYPLPYLSFMGIGISFSYHFRGRLHIIGLFLVAAALFATFAYSLSFQPYGQSSIIAFGYALVLFGGMYFFAPAWTGGRTVSFFANISFPLYASHAAFGYVSLAVMIGMLGWNPLIALAVQFVAAILLAWIVHRRIEVPTHQFGKTIGKDWLDRRLRRAFSQ